MAVDPKVNAILYLRFGRVHIGPTLYHYRNKKQYGYKKSRDHQNDVPCLQHYFISYYIKLFASARISSPIASAASCVGPSE